MEWIVIAAFVLIFSGLGAFLASAWWKSKLEKWGREAQDLSHQEQSRIYELEAAIDELRNEVASLGQQNSDMHATNLSLQHRLNDAVAEKSKALEREKDALALLKQANDHQTAAKSRVAALEASNNSLRAQFTSLSREFEDERSRHADSRRQRDGFFARSNDLAKEAEDLRVKLKHAQDTKRYAESCMRDCVENHRGVMEKFKIVRACCKAMQDAMNTDIPQAI